MSLTLTAPPAVSDTVLKSLLGLDSVMLPLAAVKLAAPATDIRPPLCVMLPLPALKLAAPATVTAPPDCEMLPLLALAVRVPVVVTL